MRGGHRAPGKSRSQIKEEQIRRDERARLEKVVRKLSVFELLEHLDSVGSAMAKAVQVYRKDDDEIYPLLETRRALGELDVVVEELILRHEAAHDEH